MLEWNYIFVFIMQFTSYLAQVFNPFLVFGKHV